MRLNNKIAQYKNFKKGVTHCTFNPEGPGVVRIHLVPPKLRIFGNSPYIVILNGYYMLPLGYSWAIILSNFMEEVNKHANKEISDTDADTIYKNTVTSVLKTYPALNAAYIREDLDEMLSDGGFDAITISTGDQTHAEIAVKAMEKGYHVFCEKPITTNAKAYALLKDIADSEGLIYMEAIIPIYTKFRKAIKEGRVL